MVIANKAPEGRAAALAKPGRVSRETGVARLSPRLTARDPIFQDIDPILRAPSDITRSEMEATGGFAEWRRDLREDVAHPDGAGFTIALYGKPIAILTHLPIPATPDRATTFAAKQDYFDLGTEGVRFTRREVAREFQKFANSRFVARTASEHPDLSRWMGAIGLRPIDGGAFEGGKYVQKVLE